MKIIFKNSAIKGYDIFKIRLLKEMIMILLESTRSSLAVAQNETFVITQYITEKVPWLPKVWILGSWKGWKCGL